MGCGYNLPALSSSAGMQGRQTCRCAPSLLYLPALAAALPAREMAGPSGNQATDSGNQATLSVCQDSPQQWEMQTSWKDRALPRTPQACDGDSLQGMSIGIPHRQPRERYLSQRREFALSP